MHLKSFKYVSFAILGNIARHATVWPSPNQLIRQIENTWAMCIHAKRSREIMDRLSHNRIDTATFIGLLFCPWTCSRMGIYIRYTMVYTISAASARGAEGLGGGFVKLRIPMDCKDALHVHQHLEVFEEWKTYKRLIYIYYIIYIIYIMYTYIHNVMIYMPV